MAKPDNRADNAEKLQDMVQNTLENAEESEEYLAEFADELPASQVRHMREKNERRRQSVEGFREEIKDEASDH
ncbi:small acid-soluble spore protein Tlp [Xylanibacillus composti]|uniref:Small, acid-soluble spore protein Tlp n=1 Tax=Xylanibacillus composti TaxID=1572762 RepID=A0A8J4H270_9BACL|nr:small acid-soluble spore protein Tlp [Xylanibacillus composti]MDT9724246.1 small acid-soluble spore protein Tlp [Xylanibacillus composti]GIQ68236.1 small, acid-soluble spore protein Tlp [Xylanibacillus composti]